MAYDRRTEPSSAAVKGPYRLDVRRHLGKVLVQVDRERRFELLDPDRAAILRCWVDAVIPAVDGRPLASETGAAEYVDANVFRAPELRAVLIAALDRVELSSLDRFNVSFTAAGREDQVAVLRLIEASDTSGAFAMVRDLTYEAYYTDQLVLEALERETGWRSEVAISGSEMEPFDEELLARMRRVPPSWRQA